MSSLRRTRASTIAMRSSLLVCLSLFMAGCESMLELDEVPPSFPAHDEVSVSNRFGGTHYRTVVRGRLWYQTFGSELLVLDTHDGTVITRIEP